MTFSFRIALTLSIRNLSRNKARNLTLGTLIALGISFLVLGNAIIDTSNTGLQASFINNFTGDLIVGAHSEEPTSLFGIDLPVVGELARLPYLEFPEKIYASIQETGLSASIIPMLSSPVGLGIAGLQLKSIAFGVEGKEYFDTFNQFTLIRGDLPINAANWIVLPERRAEEIEKNMSRPLEIGEEISLNYYSDSSFSIRTVKVAAIIRHHLDNEALLKTVWVGAHTLRDLLGIATINVDSVNTSENSSFFDDPLEDLFAAAETDLVITDNKSTDLLTELSDSLANAEAQRQQKRIVSPYESLPSLPADRWHFIIIKLREGVTPNNSQAALNQQIEKLNLPVALGDWKSAAGSMASYILALKAIFNLALVVLAIVITFILSNALLISIFERTKEIGTIRALGAPKSFVKVLLGSEIMLLCFCAGLVGVSIGVIAVLLLNSHGLFLENPLLINLFGSRQLRPRLELTSLVFSSFLSLLIGIVSWILPLQKALRISPLNAIRQES